MPPGCNIAASPYPPGILEFPAVISGFQSSGQGQ